MARGVNKVILIGNLGGDPEVRFTSTGNAIATLSLATSESWRDKQSGQQQEKTEWHRVVIFGKLAEIAQQYVRKGSKVYIEGKLQTRKWQDQQGNDRYTTEIVVDNFNGQLQMLDSRQDGGAPSVANNAYNPSHMNQDMGHGQQQFAAHNPAASAETGSYGTPAPATAQPQQNNMQRQQNSGGVRQQRQATPAGQQQGATANAFDNFDDDIPF